jgi:hypothetical protein
MRQVKAALGLSLLLLGAGCNGQLNIFRGGGDRVGPPPDKVPQVGELVEYLNYNAHKVTAIQADAVAIDCKENGRAIGLDGQLAVQKTRNFRLKARVLGQDMVDIGSNDLELWYWIGKADPPYVFHCDHEAMARGGARMGFPFQPDMVLAALNMADYDPKKPYELKVNPKTLELIEPGMSPQGQPIKKVVVFDRSQAGPGKPQVIAHVLKDAQGRDICTATIYEVQTDQATGAVLPTTVKFVWPDQKIEMKMRLGKLRSVTIEQERAAKLFSRQALSGLPSFDLARGQLDQPGGVGQVQSFQRTGGEARAPR